MEKIKHYFLSANSCDGFCNYYKYLNSKETKEFTFILKGGPGTGKSTMLKNIGKHFSSSGFKIEYFHCSSDPQSLDGVRLVDFNISVVDGTSPHVMNSNVPLIDSKIVNLEQFINNEIIKDEAKINRYLQKKKEHYALAYLYLKVAGELYKIQTLEKINPNEVKRQTKKILKNLKLSARKKQGEVRKMFLGATGFEDNFIKQNNYQQIIQLNFTPLLGSEVLKNLSNEIVKKGYDITSVFSPLVKDFQEGIIINRRNTLLIIKKTSLPILPYFKHFEMSEELLNNAKENLLKAKENHKKVEKYYIKNLNIKGLTQTTKKLITEIEQKITNNQI